MLRRTPSRNGSQDNSSQATSPSPTYSPNVYIGPSASPIIHSLPPYPSEGAFPTQRRGVPLSRPRMLSCISPSATGSDDGMGCPEGSLREPCYPYGAGLSQSPSPHKVSLEGGLRGLPVNGDVWRQIRIVFYGLDTDNDEKLSCHEMLHALDLLGIRASPYEVNNFFHICGMVSGLELTPIHIFIRALVTSRFAHNPLGSVREGSMCSSLLNRTAAVIHPQPIREKVSTLERIGSRYIVSHAQSLEADAERIRRAEYNQRVIQRMSARHEDPFEEPAAQSHIVTAEMSTEPDRKEMASIRNRVILRSALCAFLCAMICGLAEHIAKEKWPLKDSADIFGDFSSASMEYWLVILGVTILSSILEVLYVYKQCLRASFRLAYICGLQLFPIDPTRSFLTTALSRCALELGHPTYAVAGIDPLGRMHDNVALAAQGAVYKSKGILTTFFLRLFIKRFSSRAVSKIMLPFASAPLLVMWNVTVTYFIMREAHLVALGPAVVLPVSNALCDSLPFVIPLYVRQDMVQAIGLIVRCSKKVHPSLEILLLHLRERFGLTESAIQLDQNLLCRRLASSLYTEELRRLVVLHAILAVVVTGRVRMYRDTLCPLMFACEFRCGLRRIRRLVAAFRQGVTFTATHVAHCLEDRGVAEHPSDEDTWCIKFRRALVWLMAV